ncbi:MAG: YHYH protein [Chloroflexota bacterium]
MNRKHQILILLILITITLISCGPPPPRNAGQPSTQNQSTATALPTNTQPATDKSLSEAVPPTNTPMTEASTEQSLPRQSNDCPGNQFVDPTGTDLEMTITCTDEHIVIVSNNMPSLSVPGRSGPDEKTYRIPRYPQLTSEITALPKLDTIGVSVNGIQLHGPNGAEFDGYPDPIHEQMVIFCNGHHFVRNIFHFHGRPDCILSQLIDNPEDVTQQVGVVLGYAFDGFPILSPYVCADEACTTVTKLQSSWQRVADVTDAWQANTFVDGSGDLDQCNGRLAEDGTYAYYATDTFPYFLGCYSGIVETNNPNPRLSGRR